MWFASSEQAPQGNQMWLRCLKPYFQDLDAVDYSFSKCYRKVLIMIVIIAVVVFFWGIAVVVFFWGEWPIWGSAVIMVVCFGLVVCVLILAKERLDHMQEKLLERAKLEGHVHVPRYIQDPTSTHSVSWAFEEFKLPPSTTKQKLSCRNENAKLAFHFLLEKDLPFQEVWSLFFEGAKPGQFIAIVHRSHENWKDCLQQDLGFEHTNIDRVSTDYGAAVPAHQALISTSLKDAHVRGGVFISANCVPVKPFSEVHAQLLGADSEDGQHRSVLTFASERFDKCTHWQFQTREFMDKYVKTSVLVDMKEVTFTDWLRRPRWGKVLSKGLRPAFPESSQEPLLDKGRSDDSKKSEGTESIGLDTATVSLYHSQEEFYAPAVAIRYHLPCVHGYVTLDIWDKNCKVLTELKQDAPKVDDKRAREKKSPLLFKTLTKKFLENISETEICFLRKVDPNEETTKVLCCHLKDKSNGKCEAQAKMPEGLLSGLFFC